MNATTYCSYLESPIGRVLLAGDGDFVTGLWTSGHKGWSVPEPTWREDDAPLRPAREQLAEYFAGERREFDLPLKLVGTPFQQQVWQELTRIPFGVTITYAELAARIGQPKAVRAVGHANGRNPVSIIVPCHRVIGAKGALTGYGGGLERKRWLLDWEHGAPSLFPDDRAILIANGATNVAIP